MSQVEAAVEFEVGSTLIGGEKAPVVPQDNNMKGSLFVNKKRTKATHPTTRGRAMIDGKHYWISGWDNTAQKSGEQYIGLVFEELTAEEVQQYVK